MLDDIGASLRRQFGRRTAHPSLPPFCPGTSGAAVRECSQFDHLIRIWRPRGEASAFLARNSGGCACSIRAYVACVCLLPCSMALPRSDVPVGRLHGGGPTARCPRGSTCSLKNHAKASRFSRHISTSLACAACWPAWLDFQALQKDAEQKLPQASSERFCSSPVRAQLSSR